MSEFYNPDQRNKQSRFQPADDGGSVEILSNPNWTERDYKFNLEKTYQCKEFLRILGNLEHKLLDNFSSNAAETLPVLQAWRERILDLIDYGMNPTDIFIKFVLGEDGVMRIEPILRQPKLMQSNLT